MNGNYSASSPSLKASADKGGNNAVNMRKKEDSQPCPQCGEPIGLIAGSHEAICPNCGFKDPCCE